MRGFDAFAGVIKSGGKTAAPPRWSSQRRPSRHRRLHRVQAKEEAKAHTLIAAGYDAPAPTPKPSRPSSSRTPTTLSASTTSSCTHGSRDADFPPAPSRTAHREDLQGRDLNAQGRRSHLAVRRSRHAVRHHHQPAGTPPRTPGRITRPTPARRYMFLDNSACNLASFNLMKFVTRQVPLTSRPIAMHRRCAHRDDIPRRQLRLSTEKISRNSHDYRPSVSATPISARCS